MPPPLDSIHPPARLNPKGLNPKGALSLLLRSAGYLLLVLALGGGFWIGLYIAMSPNPPDSSGSWVFVQAPKLPFLWHRGWWIRCENPPDAEIECAVASGSDKHIVYEGPYRPCPSSQPGAPLIQPAPGTLAAKFWLIAPDSRPAPIIPVVGGSFLVPAGMTSACPRRP